jgi:hypothetical protein
VRRRLKYSTSRSDFVDFAVASDGLGVDGRYLGIAVQSHDERLQKLGSVGKIEEVFTVVSLITLILLQPRKCGSRLGTEELQHAAGGFGVVSFR